jgi:hypothetical protein
MFPLELITTRKWSGALLCLAGPLVSCASAQPPPVEPAKRVIVDRCQLEAVRTELTQHDMTAEDAKGCVAKCATDDQAACVALGLLLIEGRLMASNPEQATSYFQTACAQGYAPGCTHLGEVLARTQTLSNNGRTMDLYGIACEAGDALGCLRRKNGTAEGIPSYYAPSNVVDGQQHVNKALLADGISIRPLPIGPAIPPFESIKATRRASCKAAGAVSSEMKKMSEFIDFVAHVENSASTGSNPKATALQIFKTVYDSDAFEWLLPSTKGQNPVSISGTVTANEVANVCKIQPALHVEPTGGGQLTPMHVISALVAHGETLAPGAVITSKALESELKSAMAALAIESLPKGISQRRLATWAGDIGKAAAYWAVSYGDDTATKTNKQYMDETCSQSDLMADIDGVAMTSASTSTGFAFDSTKSLSDNLRLFFDPTPGKRMGRERRFHIFCNVEGFDLEQDGVTLKSTATDEIRDRVVDIALWFGRNDPSIQGWSLKKSTSFLIGAGGANGAELFRQWGKRGTKPNLQWFANEFIEFLQDNLKKEGK